MQQTLQMICNGYTRKLQASKFAFLYTYGDNIGLPLYIFTEQAVFCVSAAWHVTAGCAIMFALLLKTCIKYYFIENT